MKFGNTDLRGIVDDGRAVRLPTGFFQPPAPEPLAVSGKGFQQGSGYFLLPSEASKEFLENFVNGLNNKDALDNGVQPVTIRPMPEDTPKWVGGFFNRQKPNEIALPAQAPLSTLAHEAEHLKRFNLNPEGHPGAVMMKTFDADPRTFYERARSWTSNAGEDFKQAMKTGFVGPLANLDGSFDSKQPRLYGYPNVEEEAAANRGAQKALGMYATPAQLSGFNKNPLNWVYPASYGGENAATGFLYEKLQPTPISSDNDFSYNFASAPPDYPLQASLDIQKALKEEVGPKTKELVESYIGKFPIQLNQ